MEEEEILTKDLKSHPVQPKACKTCPFEGETPIRLEPERFAEYYQKLIQFESQHLCHSVDNKAICRGGRNLQLKLLHRLGLIKSQTDEAFNEAMDEALKVRKKLGNR